jgi:hypothetical protein
MVGLNENSCWGMSFQFDSISKGAILEDIETPHLLNISSHSLSTIELSHTKTPFTRSWGSTLKEHPRVVCTLSSLLDPLNSGVFSIHYDKSGNVNVEV